MKCRLYCRDDELTPYWVKWHELGELWARDYFGFLESSSLERAYHKLWFKNGEDGQLHFQMGEIFFSPEQGHVNFHNGRHRTILLSSLLEVIPIAVGNTILESDLFKHFLVRPIEKDEVIELPDFEILSANQLRQSTQE
jgi:hypothetical protein